MALGPRPSAGLPITEEEIAAGEAAGYSLNAQNARKQSDAARRGQMVDLQLFENYRNLIYPRNDPTPQTPSSTPPAPAPTTPTAAPVASPAATTTQGGTAVGGSGGGAVSGLAQAGGGKEFAGAQQSLAQYIPQLVGAQSAGRQGIGQRQSPALTGLLQVRAY